MTSTSNVNTSALLILQQSNGVQVASDTTVEQSSDLVSIANGQSGKIGSSTQPTQAESKISEAVFSVNHRSVTQLKLDLIERTGKALGIERDDYTSADEFASAMKDAVGKIRMQQDGQQTISKIERDLGLDKLGLSLNDVIDSARDPDADDKVTKALGKEAADRNSDQEDHRNVLLGKPDEIGLYGNIAN